MKPNATMFRSKRVFVFVVGALAGIAPATADTISLTPTADAFVAAAQPANNYGGAGALSVAAAGLSKGEFQSVIRYDVAAAKAQFDATYGMGNWIIESVTLRLTATPPNNAIFNSSAAGQFHVRWMGNDSWVEGTGTPNSPAPTGIMFSTLPTFLSPNDEDLGTFQFPGGTSGSTTYTLTLPAHFQADLEAGGLVGLRLNAADSAVSYLFNSRNFGVPESRPTLTITAVVDPRIPTPLEEFIRAVAQEMWRLP